MATIEVKVPDIGDFKDVPVIEILVKPGEAIKTEQALVTLESDKATMDVPSPAAGTVKEVKVKLGDKVSEGSLLLTLTTGVSGAAPAAPAAPTATPAAPVPAPTAASASTSAASRPRRCCTSLPSPMKWPRSATTAWRSASRSSISASCAAGRRRWWAS